VGGVEVAASSASSEQLAGGAAGTAGAADADVAVSDAASAPHPAAAVAEGLEAMA
jgi:hypothetical protein